jgi:hypothetical protein
MRSKAAFIVGTGLGYVLGARAGRQRFEKIATLSRRAWQDPRVQATVSDLEAKAADLAKTEAAALKDKVAGTVKAKVASARGGHQAAEPTAGTPDGYTTGTAYTTGNPN